MGKNIAKQRNKSVGSTSPKPSSKKKDIREIELNKIDIGELCLRKNPEEDLEQLAKSIESLGLIHYPMVRQKPNGRYEIVCGHRRCLAHKRNKEKTILCRVMDVDPLDAIYIAIAENMQGIRKPADPVRVGESLQELKRRTGMPEAEIAEKIGCQQSTVAELTGLMRLPKYILEKIDNDPKKTNNDRKKRFKYSHAVEISKLEENRFYREVEVNALLNKKITLGVSSTEIRKLVQLINEGHYDRLPEPVKTFLWTSKYMTAAMARLFLYPEEIIEPDDGNAKLLCKTASALDKKERQEFIERAIKREWSYETARKELIKLIKQRSGLLQPARAQKSQADQPPMSAAQELYCDISTLLSKLDSGRYQLSDFAKSDQGDIAKLCEAGILLRRRLRSFLRALRQAFNGHKVNA